MVSALNPQLALILPYMRIGEWLTGAPHMELGPVSIKDLIKHGSGGTICFIMNESRNWMPCIKPCAVVRTTMHISPAIHANLLWCQTADLLRSVGRAVLAWVLTWPLIASGLYLALTPAFQLLRHK